eukprot:CAMPEP_0179462374 /NCGR_PEP_ID=MMETSP0799-20121207/44764_1 /TAXON_ID=46947 /ORGANISM="Geminigera cryophila, Strain CCMP2564" /LENGTH=66 /DNA_ID=CAMNT_0021265241 /DNA_START=906 /DNA_END=1103 /DNA_ORIENTATION=+
MPGMVKEITAAAMFCRVSFLRLVPYVGHQMSLDLADVKLFQTIVQRLIIREIEPKCMQLVLTIPVA